MGRAHRIRVARNGAQRVTAAETRDDANQSRAGGDHRTPESTRTSGCGPVLPPAGTEELQERQAVTGVRGAVLPEANAQDMTARRPRPGPDAFVPRGDTTDALRISNVFVVYASAHGSTKGVAERIAARLRERGARVALVFAGAIERNQWPLLSRLFFRTFGGRFGDNRDWPEIDAWDDGIPQKLGSSGA